jgi:hypothetical protein
MGEETAAGAADFDGTIPNVLVLSSKGRDGRTYSEVALKSSVKLYEGTAVFVDAPVQADRDRKGRSVLSRFGKLINCRYRNGPRGGEIRADLRFLLSHPLAKSVIESLQRHLGLFELTHNIEAVGERLADGSFLVSSISRVKEVDLISSSAAAPLREQAGEKAVKTLPPVVRRPVGRVVRIPTGPKELARWLKTSPGR